MDSEELKQSIRRRMFAAQFNPADPSRASSDYFTSCPDCAGAGKVCREYFVGGNAVAELDGCARCAGAGFIERTA
jgi:DnaJ-class molecular chaperone